MQLSPDGAKLIQAWEGIEDGNTATKPYEPYICPSRVYTVGYGHALKTPSGALIDVDVFGPAKSAKLAREAMDREFGRQALSLAECGQLLAEDSEIWSRQVSSRIGPDCTQWQFDALVSFAYNVGVGNFDTSTVKRLHVKGERRIGNVSLKALCRASQAKDSPTYMALAFARWSNANGKWTLGLFRRRISELMIYGGHDYDLAISTAKAFKPS